MAPRKTLDFSSPHLPRKALLERLPLFLGSDETASNTARRHILSALKAAPTTRLAICPAWDKLLLHFEKEAVHPFGKREFLLSPEREAAEIEAIGGEAIYLEEPLTPQAVFEAITPRTALVSIGWADPRTGVIRPLHEISAICREKKVALHVDATYVLGRTYIHLEELSDLYITFEGAALGLLPANDLLLSPDLHIGEPPPWLMEAWNFGLMTQLQEFDQMATTTSEQRAHFEDAVHLFGGTIAHTHTPRLPHISAAHFRDVHPEMLRHALATRGISTSPPLTFHFSTTHTEEETYELIDTLRTTLEALRPLTAALFHESAP